MYTIINVDSDYLYMDQYETIDDAKETIKQYEKNDVAERKIVDHYQIQDSECNIVFDSLDETYKIMVEGLKSR